MSITKEQIKKLAALIKGSGIADMPGMVCGGVMSGGELKTLLEALEDEEEEEEGKGLRVLEYQCEDAPEDYLRVTIPPDPRETIEFMMEEGYVALSHENAQALAKALLGEE